MLGRVETTDTPKGGPRANPGLVDLGSDIPRRLGNHGLVLLEPRTWSHASKLETAWEPEGLVLVEVEGRGQGLDEVKDPDGDTSVLRSMMAVRF